MVWTSPLANSCLLDSENVLSMIYLASPITTKAVLAQVYKTILAILCSLGESASFHGILGQASPRHTS